MKIFDAGQIKAWDAFTLGEMGIHPVELMERAAGACYQWIVQYGFTQQPIDIYCGKGNNGGDGLALARMLIQNGFTVNVYILESGKPGSLAFQVNLQRLHQYTTQLHFIQASSYFPEAAKNHLVIDALFGTGLNKPLEGIARQLVEYMNSLGNTIISIDMPSGMFCDKSTKGFTAITASHTLSFQNAKLAFLMPENHFYVGEFHLLNIGLSNSFEEANAAVHEITDASLMKSIIRPRNKFSHKGSFGHAVLLAGSVGMMGAAVLAARACLKSGCGKLTAWVPVAGYGILQTTAPEAMCLTGGEFFLQNVPDLDAYDSVGIGPGIGTTHETATMLKTLLGSCTKPCVLDADALNILATGNNMLALIPAGAVITPHPKEFERLFGSSSNDFDRLGIAVEKARALNIYIVLKGHYTAIITPKDKVYFNQTGNAGMAKAGMGDVLTGLITGLLGQGYLLPEAAMLAVHLHGIAGDMAAARLSQQAMTASDLLGCIPGAWKSLLR